MLDFVLHLKQIIILDIVILFLITQLCCMKNYEFIINDHRIPDLEIKKEFINLILHVYYMNLIQL